MVSVQHIEEIPQSIKDIYKTVWEVSQKVVIDMAVDRSPYICQSQSMNLWLADPTLGQINAMHFYAWKKGLKTGMYYLRSKPAANAIKVTVKDTNAKNQVNHSNNEQEDCLMCGS